MNFVLGLTQTSWDGDAVPQFMGGPNADMSMYSNRKTMAMLKIGGWMLFTLVAVLGAIRLAIYVADSFDKKPVKKYPKKEKVARKED